MITEVDLHIQHTLEALFQKMNQIGTSISDLQTRRLQNQNGSPSSGSHAATDHLSLHTAAGLEMNVEEPIPLVEKCEPCYP